MSNCVLTRSDHHRLVKLLEGQTGTLSEPYTNFDIIIIQCHCTSSNWKMTPIYNIAITRELTSNNKVALIMLNGPGVEAVFNSPTEVTMSGSSYTTIDAYWGLKL